MATREDTDLHAWIATLDVGQARQHLADRGQSTQGILPTLRACLLAYEEAAIKGKLPAQIPLVMVSDSEQGAAAVDPTPEISHWGQCPQWRTNSRNSR